MSASCVILSCFLTVRFLITRRQKAALHFDGFPYALRNGRTALCFFSLPPSARYAPRLTVTVWSHAPLACGYSASEIARLKMRHTSRRSVGRFASICLRANQPCLLGLAHVVLSGRMNSHRRKNSPLERPRLSQLAG